MGYDSETRVVLADQPGAGRSALAALVDQTPGIELIASLSDPHEIERTVRETRPDVVVADDRLLRDGRWTQTLDARLIVVGLNDDPGFAARAERLGAEAWIPKEEGNVLLGLLLNQQLDGRP